VSTAWPPLNEAVTLPVPPAARLRLAALSEKFAIAGGTLIVRLRVHVTADPRFSNDTSTADDNCFPPVNPPKLTEAGVKRMLAATEF
jgi:hypothetical protein